VSKSVRVGCCGWERLCQMLGLFFVWKGLRRRFGLGIWRNRLQRLEMSLDIFLIGLSRRWKLMLRRKMIQIWPGLGLVMRNWRLIGSRFRNINNRSGLKLLSPREREKDCWLRFSSLWLKISRVNLCWNKLKFHS